MPRTWLSIGILAFFAVAPPADARIIGRGAEISLGREVAARVEQLLPVDRDPVATARVQQLGRRLISEAEDTDLPYEFHIVETPDINAFALPGGFIYVHRGLLQLLPNDDALAFVLAHEITHAARHHAISQLERSLGLGLILGAVGGGNAAAATAVAEMVLSLKFTRDDEAEADRQGLRHMARAGFNADAAAEAMLVIRRLGSGRDLPPFLRSHPAPDSRINRLRELAVQVRQEEQMRRASSPPPPPPPRLPDQVVAGLDGIRLHACDYFPLAVGGEWHYVAKDPRGESHASVRVLEAVPGRPEGCVRLRIQLGRSVETDWLAAPAGDRLYTRPAAAETWRLEALFAADALPDPELGLRVVGLERVKVPAGEFEVLRVDRGDHGGRTLCSSWYARGVGLVKRQFATSGIMEELERYLLPSPPPAPPAVEPTRAS